MAAGLLAVVTGVVFVVVFAPNLESAEAAVAHFFAKQTSTRQKPSAVLK